MVRGEHPPLESPGRGGLALRPPRRRAASSHARAGRGAAGRAGDDASSALGPGTALEDLRRHLPGVEPERRLTDWGRSERVERLVDRTLADFLYRLWFRCEVEGVDHVPATGGALLVANHAGALPPDAAMIAKAVREEHPRARSLNVAVDPAFRAHPGLSMLLPKLGCVADHPANLERLLHDEDGLVLGFPEGREATRKLFKDRYRMRGFGRGELFAAALGAGAPIVPVCVVGAEEAAPVFARLELLQRLTRSLPSPFAHGLPHLGPAAMATYLPAKFRIRFLEPLRIDAPAGDRAAVQTASEEVHARIQGTLLEMVGARDSVWFG